MADTTYEELTGTPEEMRLYQQERAIEYVTAMIARLMKEKGVSNSQLAARLGVVPGWITQLLDGEKNKTVRTLSDVLWALDESLEFSHKPLGPTKTAVSNGHGGLTFDRTVPWGNRGSALVTTSRQTWHSATKQLA
jgi:hypothetical protein